jgi:ABC-type Fe3+-hydroxamate transport system substrate-binding protein
LSITVKDQLGRVITLPHPPQRIVSVVPSQTELLFDLGLREEVVGITKFCIHPDEWFRSKTRVGGTKTLDPEKIKALEPDLIIANKEENDHAQIEALIKQYPVYVSDIKNLDDALSMIKDIGQLTQREQEANQLAMNIHDGMSQLTLPQRRLSCAYFIWWEPIMTVNHDTSINDMLERCGFDNVFRNDASSRYPVIDEAALVAAQPELILLSSEPYPFKEKHMDYFRQLLPNAKVMIVDGEMFSWYGSRLLKAPSYLQQVIHQLSSVLK